MLVLLPACLMLMAGAFYWVRVRLTAEQLLPSALRDYLRQQADIDLQMERVQLGWARLQAWNLTLSLPDGTPLGNTRYLELSPPQPGQPLRVRLERPRLLLRRDAHGRWNIEPLLKRPPRRAAVQIPLELVSTNGVLEFQDESLRPHVAHEVRLPRVQLRQPGSSTMVQAHGDAPGLGALNLHALSDGERWRLNLGIERLRWATIAPYLSEWRMANDAWRMTEGETALQLEMFYAPHQPLRLTGKAQGVLQGLRYQQVALPWHEIRFETQFTESLLNFRLHTPDGRLHAAGTLERTEKGQGLRYALALQSYGNDASVIERIVRRVANKEEANLVPARKEEQMLLTARPYAFQIQAAGSWTPRKGWRDLLAQTNAIGQIRLEQLRTPEGILRQVQVPFLLTRGQLRIHDAQADFAEGRVHANALVDLTPHTPRFLLTARMRSLPLEQLSTLREAKLGGTIELQLLGEGTLRQPRLIANVLSEELRYNGARLGALRVRLIYEAHTLQIPTAILQGAIGSVHITGSIPTPQATHQQPLALQFRVDELDLNRLASLLGYREGVLGYWEQEAGQNRALRLDGIAYARGTLRGTLDKPELRAQATVFNGRLGDIGMELLAAQVVFHPRRGGATTLQGGRILLPEITIYRRTAVAHASGEIELSPAPSTPGKEAGVKIAAFKLQGSLADFDLAALGEWGESPIKLAGLANLSFIANGTPDQFEITGELSLSKTQVDKLVAEGASAQFHLTHHMRETELRLDTAQVQLGAGAVLGQARLIWDEQGTHLHANWRAQTVPLQVLAPYLPADYRLHGVLNAEGTAQGWLDALQAETTWQLAQLNLNEVALGEAMGTAQWIPLSPASEQARSVGVPAEEPSVRSERSGFSRLVGQLILQARLNAPEGSIEIDSLHYTPGDGTIEAQGTIASIPIEWVRQLMLSLPVDLPPDVVEHTDTLDGKLSTRWQLAGTLEKPQLAFDGRATQLAWNGQTLGELQAQGNWDREQLGFQLRWQAESARLEARGTWQKEALHAEMELNRFPLEWVQLWEPSLPPIKGTLDLTLLATGDPNRPDLTLSATVQNLTFPILSNTTDPSDRAEFTIDQLLFSRIDVREGAISTEDALIQVHDYRARLSGRLPFHWSPLEIPRDEPISIQLALRDQPLRLFELFLPIDTERTHGTLNARLMIDGTLNELQPRGELQIAEGSLAFEQLSTYLQNLRLQVEFDGQRARITQAQARSSAGGQLTLTGEVDVAREEPTLALTGAFERFTVNEPRLPIGGSAFGRVNGEVALQGTLKKPHLMARLRVQDGLLSLPAEIQTAPSGSAPPINPELDVQVQVARGFTLRNPNLDARMEGVLQIAGSLSAVRANGTFSLQGGALNLPTARLRLEPESLILLTYPYTTPAGETIARLDLNVRATTTVVALDYTGDPQRYRVELDIRGPLDDPERFQMVARSDPPGLSEQRILSLLGRGSALEALARGGDPVQIFRQQLSEMVTGQVLPGLLAPIETGIAEALGLEQFALDYTGGIAPASLYLVKELFNGFGISYRRSLTLANPQYEVRLFYRLPFRNRFLQRLKIGWGFDNAQRQFLFVEGSLLFR